MRSCRSVSLHSPRAWSNRWAPRGGLFRNYWVIAKLVLTIVGAGLLLLHTSVISDLAAGAREPIMPEALRSLRVQVVGDAIAAIVLLVVTVGLSVFKPQGLTPYGWRKRRA